MASATLDIVEDQLKDIITNLYSLIVQSHDYNGPQTGAAAMTYEITHLIRNLLALTRTTRSPALASVRLPPEIIEYVEGGRNAEIYTREFVELAQRMNQRVRGRSEAFAAFRDALAREIEGVGVLGEGVVREVVVATRGKAG